MSKLSPISRDVGVSVCMATCNGEKYLREQLSSILLQLHDSDEIIISDDASTDRSIEIIASFKDLRIKVFKHKYRLGVIKNFEYALLKASKKIIILADHDDVWLPGKRNLIVDELRNCHLVVTDAAIIDSVGNITGPSYFEIRKSGPGFFRNICRNSYIGCCMGFRREILSLALPFKKHCFHDISLGMVAEIFFSVRFKKAVLTHYRTHCGNYTSAAINSSKRKMYEKVRDRIALLHYIVIVAMRGRSFSRNK